MTDINPHDALRLKLAELESAQEIATLILTPDRVQQFIDDTAELLLWAEKCIAQPFAQLYRFPIESAIPREDARVRSLRIVRQKLQMQECAL